MIYEMFETIAVTAAHSFFSFRVAALNGLAPHFLPAVLATAMDSPSFTHCRHLPQCTLTVKTKKDDKETFIQCKSRKSMRDLAG